MVRHDKRNDAGSSKKRSRNQRKLERKQAKAADKGPQCHEPDECPSDTSITAVPSNSDIPPFPCQTTRLSPPPNGTPGQRKPFTWDKDKILNDSSGKVKEIFRRSIYKVHVVPEAGDFHVLDSSHEFCGPIFNKKTLSDLLREYLRVADQRPSEDNSIVLHKMVCGTCDGTRQIMVKRSELEGEGCESELMQQGAHATCSENGNSEDKGGQDIIEDDSDSCGEDVEYDEEVEEEMIPNICMCCNAPLDTQSNISSDCSEDEASSDENAMPASNGNEDSAYTGYEVEDNVFDSDANVAPCANESNEEKVLADNHAIEYALDAGGAKIVYTKDAKAKRSYMPKIQVQELDNGEDDEDCNSDQAHGGSDENTDEGLVCVSSSSTEVRHSKCICVTGDEDFESDQAVFGSDRNDSDIASDYNDLGFSDIKGDHNIHLYSYKTPMSIENGVIACDGDRICKECNCNYGIHTENMHSQRSCSSDESLSSDGLSSTCGDGHLVCTKCTHLLRDHIDGKYCPANQADVASEQEGERDTGDIDPGNNNCDAECASVCSDRDSISLGYGDYDDFEDDYTAYGDDDHIQETQIYNDEAINDQDKGHELTVETHDALDKVEGDVEEMYAPPDEEQECIDVMDISDDEATDGEIIEDMWAWQEEYVELTENGDEIYNSQHAYMDGELSGEMDDTQNEEHDEYVIEEEDEDLYETVTYDYNRLCNSCRSMTKPLSDDEERQAGDENNYIGENQENDEDNATSIQDFDQCEGNETNPRDFNEDEESLDEDVDVSPTQSRCDQREPIYTSGFEETRHSGGDVGGRHRCRCAKTDFDAYNAEKGPFSPDDDIDEDLLIAKQAALAVTDERFFKLKTKPDNITKYQQSKDNVYVIIDYYSDGKDWITVVDSYIHEINNIFNISNYTDPHNEKVNMFKEYSIYERKTGFPHKRKRNPLNK